MGSYLILKHAPTYWGSIYTPQLFNILASNVESLNNTFTFKEDTIQPDIMVRVKNNN